MAAQPAPKNQEAAAHSHSQSCLPHAGAAQSWGVPAEQMVNVQPMGHKDWLKSSSVLPGGILWV